MLNRRFFLASGASLASTLLRPSYCIAASSSVPLGFIFVGTRTCPLCKNAAPVIALFCERMEIECLYATPDEAPMMPFREYVEARGHPLMASVKYYPTTLLYSKKAEEVIAQVEGFKSAQFYVDQLVTLIEFAAELGHV